MTKYFYFLLAISLIACGKDSKESGNNNGGQSGNEQSITAKEPCFDGQFSTNLPSNLADPNNYVQYEATAELVTTILATESLLNSLSSLFLGVPATAINATVDNINVSSTDKALEWTDGEEKFIYLEKENGYEIKYLENSSDILASTIVSVGQNDDCTSFSYDQYAGKDEGDVMQGTLLFYLQYDKAGSANILEYGQGLEDEDSETVRIRDFGDGSGTMRKVNKNTGQDNRVYRWNADGSGSWEIYENGVIAEQGTWSF